MSSLAIVNARLLDPASDYDGPGSVLIEDGRIVEVAHGVAAANGSGEVIDAQRLAYTDEVPVNSVLFNGLPTE